MHVGFTGTRYGVSLQQAAGIARLLGELWKRSRGFVAHHGDCMGADATFYRLLQMFARVRIVCHPASSPRGWRAFVGGHEIRQELHPLARNAVIVRESTVVIAAPLEPSEKPRGGTWSTIRRARAAPRPLAIVWRNGEITKERWV